jgi:CSLREA domain-containing protein
MTTRHLRYALPILILGVVTFTLRPAPVRAATYTVNTAEDRDGRCGDGGLCSLREAIKMANEHSGSDIIEFNIPGSTPITIHPTASLPRLTDDGTTIAGDTQPGYTLGLHYTSGLHDRGIPVIAVDGSLLTRGVGLDIHSSNNVIRGLKLVNFTLDDQTTIFVDGFSNRIEKNIIGFSNEIDPTPRHTGITLRGEENDIIDNVISGDYTGILVTNGQQTIQGNIIGLDPSGHIASGGRAAGWGFGIWVQEGPHDYPHDVIIGGSLPEDRNVISGYSPYGYGIVTTSVKGTRIINNYIGTNAAGDAAVPNWTGIELGGVRCGGTEGGICEGIEPNIVQGNVISGNETGVNADMDKSIIIGNLIGTDATGTRALSGQEYGIISMSAKFIVIGGPNPGDGNLISGNGTGIDLWSYAGGATIYGNKIGTNLAGSAAIPNTIGVLTRAETTQIGGMDAASGNLIAGNDIGVWIEGNSDSVENNRIGINAAGWAIPNREGIRAVGVNGTLKIDYNNLIAFNTSHGIHLENTVNVFVYRNVIRSNGGDAIFLERTGDPEPLKNRFRENSTYSNGGLGIRFASADLNGGVEPPIFTRITSTYMNGLACPGCLVELFLSDEDPSGFGEGKTFLTSVYATDGNFHADYGRTLRGCDTLTATALDVWSSSTFSRYYSVGWCLRMPPLVSLIWVLGSAGGWGLLVVGLVILRRRPRHLGPTATIGLGLLGGLLGAGIGIGLLAMPFVQVQWPQGQGSNQAPSSAPSCGEFLSQNLLQPADGAVFNPGTDVAIELSPQPDPPGMQTRWFLDLTGPGHKTVSKELTSTSLRLSELGFDPKQTGFYFWTLRGERSQTGSNLWTPLCTDTIQRMFQIAAPQATPLAETETTAPNANATSTATASPTQTLSPSGPTATLRQNANCRRGPGTEYDSVTNLPQGLTAPITGRNPDSSWWQVQVPGTQTRCWLAGENVDTSGDTGQVPIVEPEAIGCWVYDPNQQKNVCTVPCPEGAQPGGACTP